MNLVCSFRHHQSCRIPSLLRASAPHQNIFIVFSKHVIKTMANYARDRGTPFYWQNHSVQTPTFIDLDKYLPKPEDSSVSPFNRQYPKPIMPVFFNQKSSNETQFKGKKNKNFKATTARSTKSSDGDTLKVNVTREQRTVSLSSGESLYSKSGQDTVRRPAKRRHHSTATPVLQDEIETKRTKINYSTLQLPHSAKPSKRRHHSTATPGLQDEIEAKRTKINYATPQLPHPARSLQFNLFDTGQPVFTLETLTNEINKECVKCVQTMETLQKKLKLKAFLEGFLSPAFPGCSLHLCGSSNNGFGHDSSDADFCCIVNHLRQGNNRHHALSVLRQMQKLLNNDRKTSFLSRCSVIPATVPILKFMDSISGCDCDININNVVGVRNTHLLRAYCGVDYRVQPLVMLVKKWAKKHDINDASCGTLSSYALTLMVLHYLQGICKPAVVPVLQRQYPTVFKYHGDVSNLLSQDPCKLIACHQSENRQSLGELFVGFFKYYALDFRWNTDYISVASGSAYPRYSGQWKRKPIVIEEPFDGNNVAKAVNHQFDKIHMKFRLAWHTLKISPSLESIKVT